MIGKLVIVRTYSAGVHYGTLVARDGKEVILTDARRIWRWDGAASLSELAVRGTAKPEGCKIPPAVPEILLTEAIEVISITPEAASSLTAVPEWSAR